jgi:hypothetical protein
MTLFLPLAVSDAVTAFGGDHWRGSVAGPTSCRRPSTAFTPSRTAVKAPHCGPWARFPERALLTRQHEHRTTDAV